MQVFRIVNLDDYQRRCYTYYVDGQLYADIIRHTNKKRFDVVFRDASKPNFRGLKSRSQAEMHLF